MARYGLVAVAVAAAASVTGMAGCTTAASPDPPPLRRLTLVEYRNAIHDLLGGEIDVPADLEPLELGGARFSTVRASQASISERGIEQFQTAALAMARARFADPDGAAAWSGCAPADGGDPCVARFVRSFGRRAWRRPLASDEVARQLALIARAADVRAGLELAVAAMLASPNFLFRAELGAVDPDAPGRLRYSGYELAARLSFLVWTTTPDDELLEAAAAGTLDRGGGVRAQAERLVASPRARAGLMRFFVEQLGLDGLDTLVKDRAVYPSASPTLGASMRREIELVVEAIVFGDDGGDGDWRALVDTRRTFVNAELAALYGLPPPAGDGFAPAQFSAASGRAGLFGFAGILALGAHAAETSPTLRGRFIRERLLGQIIAPPPPGADVAGAGKLDSGAHRTMRTRLEEHRARPGCAACHARLDPLGLALEHFDGVGAFRSDDGGLALDTRGDLDGIAFDGGAELAAVLRADARVPQFLVTQLCRYALGRMDTPADAPFIAELTGRFAASGYRFLPLVVELAASDQFLFVAGGP